MERFDNKVVWIAEKNKKMYVYDIESKRITSISLVDFEKFTKREGLIN